MPRRHAVPQGAAAPALARLPASETRTTVDDSAHGDNGALSRCGASGPYDTRAQVPSCGDENRRPAWHFPPDPQAQAAPARSRVAAPGSASRVTPGTCVPTQPWGGAADCPEPRPGSRHGITLESPPARHTGGGGGKASHAIRRWLVTQRRDRPQRKIQAAPLPVRAETCPDLRLHCRIGSFSWTRGERGDAGIMAGAGVPPAPTCQTASCEGRRMGIHRGSQGLAWAALRASWTASSARILRSAMRFG